MLLQVFVYIFLGLGSERSAGGRSWPMSQQMIQKGPTFSHRLSAFDVVLKTLPTTLRLQRLHRQRLSAFDAVPVKPPFIDAVWISRCKTQEWSSLQVFSVCFVFMFAIVVLCQLFNNVYNCCSKAPNGNLVVTSSF